LACSTASPPAPNPGARCAASPAGTSGASSTRRRRAT